MFRFKIKSCHYSIGKQVTKRTRYWEYSQSDYQRNFPTNLLFESRKLWWLRRDTQNFELRNRYTQAHGAHISITHTYDDYQLVEWRATTTTTTSTTKNNERKIECSNVVFVQKRQENFPHTNAASMHKSHVEKTQKQTYVLFEEEKNETVSIVWKRAVFF